MHMQHVSTNSGNLFIGSLMDAREIHKYGKFDVIWNLASELEFLVKDEAKYAESVLFANIIDYDVPSDLSSFSNQLNLIVDCLTNSGRVFIHCFGGHGRTGMALASVLVKLHNLSVDDALSHTKNICGGPDNEFQVEFVNRFFKDNDMKKKFNREDIVDEVSKFFEEQYKKEFYSDSKNGVSVCFESDVLTIHIEKMYKGLGDIVSFANLKWLSEKLGTDDISLQNEYYYGGCDTCDWGSKHEVDIICKKVKV